MARLQLLLLMLTAGALLLDACQADEEVSFYGASYIHLLVQEAKNGTDISFRFRTHLSDAMLLLAAGRTDYCLVKLETGRLKVHINLGAGEKELASARGLQLNDMSWHSVNLTRRDANITLVVDGIHSVSEILPGKFLELNINFGVYIGGQGGFNELFLGHTEYLRGCMADITYNGLRVIEHARTRRNSTEASAVSWGCSAEFDATSRVDISFVEDGAFTAIPKSIPRAGSRWELELKTVSTDGLLLFMAGLSSHADFLGVELKNGKVRLLMNKGNGPAELIHPRNIADGTWHEVTVDFTTTLIGISVDGEARNLSLALGNKYLDLADTLYIGGTELNKRAKALSKGLESGGNSYKGCLRSMRLDGKELGLPNVKVSQGVVVNCVWGFPCAEAKPCVPGALCSQLGVRSFKCTCDRDLCIKSNFTEEYKFNTNLPINLELLRARPISVLEGKRAALTERHISLTLDIARYQLNESHVVFALLTPPAHGWLQLDRSRLAVKTPFTLHDVHMHKIVYMHDGGETTVDNMVLKFAVQAASPRHALPNYFQDSLRFELYVNITPVNDPPRLEIPPNAVLTLAQGTRKTLTKDLIFAEDADTPAEKLVYTVLPEDGDIGHVERLASNEAGSSTGISVRTFTQAELARGAIDYVHSGKNKTTAILSLKVSDGEASSQVQKLRISAHKLSIRAVQNTGLVVVHRSFSYLTSANLSFATNADDSRVEIRYNVTGKPRFGILQRQRETSYTWINTDYFTSRDLERQTVRYLHTMASPHNDSFRFEVSVREVHFRDTYDFNITFITLELLEIQRSSVDFVNSAEVVVDSRRIKFQTNPLVTEAALIVYSLLKTPRFGHLYLANERLMIGQTFTQEDIDNGRLRYRHYRRAFSPIEDRIEFKVSAPQCQDVSTSLNFSYEPMKESNLAFEGAEIIRVMEGQKVPLSMARFDYRHFGVTSLSFNLTMRPRHGCLSLYEATLPVVLNITHFTLEELNRRAVFYVHDDSETKEDAFEFLAMSTDDTDFMYIDRVNVQVELRNDNSPKRINKRIFHVVTNSEKLITRSDLLYTDDDLNTKPSDLMYHVKQLSNGLLHKLNNPSVKIDWFTQQDIDNEKIVYRHHGNMYERIDFTVSDGELFSNGDLEIQAGHAYVKLMLHKGAVVQTNRSVLLSAKDIDMETNVFANNTEITYHVKERPKYGVILKYGKETWNFNREDLIRQHVVYKHVRPPNREIVEDKFQLKVTVGEAYDSGEFGIKIYPEIYWEPLIIKHNSTIYVEEATSVILNNKSLAVGYPGIPSNKITYHVRQWPRYGYLEVQSYENDDFDEFNTNLVKHFGQNLIDEHHVSYVQSTPNQTHDVFLVDVSNGITWSRNLTVNIVIVPDKLYVAARNLSVLEGKSVILQDFDFYTVTPYFAGKITEYTIVEKPRHGNMMDLWNNPIRNFTHKQLVSKEIVYKNNGDEQLVDKLRMMVKAGEKSSQQFDLWINIAPINDEPPVVVNKSVFSMWQGGSVVITNDLLAAADNDTMPNEIFFEIQNVIGGYFSMKEISGISIHNFSQEMINEQRVLFTHTNGSRAEVKFFVFDGLHKTDVYKLLVTTKPVQVLIGHNEILNVFPLARKLITSDLLLTKCTDADRDVKYFVRNGPHMGRIIMETNEGIWLKVDRFTQQDLNNSRVSYEHNKPFNSLAANDSFVFDVEAYFATPIRNQVFEVKISVSNGGLHHHVSVDPVFVVEGKKAAVTINITGIIDFLRTNAAIPIPDVSVRLLRQPNHGHVMLEPNNLNLTTFSQNEVESGRITYYHDNSDTLKDEIQMSVYFSPGHLTLCNITVPVEISPVNDQQFKLEKNKLEPIVVVQNQTQTVTRQNFLTTDPDTGPEGIVYELMNIPQGRFLLFDNASEVQQVTRFTQRDVDSSRLVYEHRGSLSAKAIYYRVSDGQYEFDYNILNVQVQSIRLNVSVMKPVEIKQGSTTANIDTEVLRLDTNVRHDLVMYQVTRAPMNGALHARESSVIFRHADLISKSVFYVQNDLNTSNDSVVLSARVAEKEQTDIVIPIVVVPLMIMSDDFIAYAGDKSKLTIPYFDATPLAKLADSEPKFKVTRKPEYAKIMQIVNRTTSSGEKKDLQVKEVTKFTHSHILSGLIYLVCTQVPSDDPHGVKDSFDFMLAVPTSTGRFQPAIGTFVFHAKLASDYYNNSLDGPMDPVGHEGEMPIAPNMSDDYTLLLGMLCGVVLLSLCVIVTIRCRQARFKGEEDEEEDEEEEDQDKVEPASPASVMSLPRPPDHLLPATPHLKRYTNDLHNNSIGSSTPLPPIMPTLTSTLPQCKVIPLSPMDNMTGSEVDVSARYPYGVADSVDDWSSFDTTEIPCPSQTSQRTNPLLRRNQYWV
ncbi:chondroitin sulfate proteoglycan 4 [Phymastichus coffea]|uniref:chondroitin sulfate proteoglycan 4 n=1 Tax=Phymastichus coffea TaxID=108790 RepID=UPI00273C33EC|nr:chondroitin sulfate proteoglycan 4 [Phymastichus coffea]